jgi:hypothetical protein
MKSARDGRRCEQDRGGGCRRRSRVERCRRRSWRHMSRPTTCNRASVSRPSTGGVRLLPSESPKSSSPVVATAGASSSKGRARRGRRTTHARSHGRRTQSGRANVLACPSARAGKPAHSRHLIVNIGRSLHSLDAVHSTAESCCRTHAAGRARVAGTHAVAGGTTTTSPGTSRSTWRRTLLCNPWLLTWDDPSA